MPEKGLSCVMDARGKTATCASMAQEFGVARGSARELLRRGPLASERRKSRTIDARENGDAP